MERHGEFALNIIDVNTLFLAFKEDSSYKVRLSIDSRGIVYGFWWVQLDTVIEIIQPGLSAEVDKSRLMYCYKHTKKTHQEMNIDLAKNVFHPTETHIPLIVIINRVGDYGYSDETHQQVIDWCENMVSATRIGLVEQFGGWLPEKDSKVFNRDTWDSEWKYLPPEDRERYNIQDIHLKISMHLYNMQMTLTKDSVMNQ